MQSPSLTTEQVIVDREQLRLLSLFYYVTGGLNALVSLFFLLYMGLGLYMSIFVSNDAGAAASVFAGIFGFAFLAISASAGCTIYAGRCIAQRKARTFSLIMGGLSCLNFPYGTILGIFTFMVLTRDSVRAAYDQAAGNRLLGAAGAQAPGAPLSIGTKLPPPQVSANPYGSQELHHDPEEEKMWKDLEKKALQNKANGEQSSEQSR